MHIEFSFDVYDAGIIALIITGSTVLSLALISNNMVTYLVTSRR